MQDRTRGIEEKHHWERMCQDRPLSEVPWEEGKPCAELIELIDSGVVPRGPALDIGAGSGNNSVYLPQQGFACYGIDISPTAIDYARDKAARAGVSCEFALGDVTDLAYPDQSFILVFDRGCFNSIFPEERATFIKGVHRVLKPGGKYHLNCFSKTDHEDRGIPHSFSPEDLQRYFAPLFKIHSIEERHNDRRGATQYWLTALLERQ